MLGELEVPTRVVTCPEPGQKTQELEPRKLRVAGAGKTAHVERAPENAELLEKLGSNFQIVVVGDLTQGVRNLNILPGHPLGYLKRVSKLVDFLGDSLQASNPAAWWDYQTSRVVIRVP